MRSLALAILLGLALPPVLASRAQDTPIRNLAPTGDVSKLAAAVESARAFPVFVLPMGNGFYDFELKASVDNFTAGHLVYFFASATDAQPQNPVWDADPRIFYSVGGPGDGRFWRGANPASPLYGQIGDANARLGQIVVIPSKITGSASWMYRGNAHLVWSYVRISAVGPETDPAGRVVWNPVLPVDWRAERTTP